MDKKDVDIVIISYNRKDLLTSILKKLETQTNKNFNLIISDDGTRPEEMINPNNFPIITKYLWNKDVGYCRVARINDGIKSVVSDNAIFLDDDCVPKTDNFVAAHLENLKNYKISRGVIRFPDGGDAGCWFSTANVGIRKEVLDATGIFDPNYNMWYGYEDHDYGNELKKRGFNVSAPWNEETTTMHLGNYYADGDRSDAIMWHNREHFIKKWNYDAAKVVIPW